MRKISEYHYITLLAILLLIGYIPLNISLEYLNFTYGPRLTDFDTYYHSADRFINGNGLYAETTGPNGSSRKFVYPPLAIIIFIPFSLLPFSIAGILWNILSLLILSAGVIRLYTELLSKHEIEATKWVSSLVVLCIIGFSPTVNWLKAGQASGIVAGGLCYSVAYTINDHSGGGNNSAILASILIPAISIIKPYYAPSGAHLLQNFNRFKYGILATGSLAGLSISLLGVDLHADYLNQLVEGESNLIFTTPPVHWNASIYSPLYIFGELAVEIRLMIVLSVIILVIFLTKTGHDPLNVGLLGIVIIPLATPTRVDGLVALIPVYLVVLVRYWNNRSFRISAFTSIILVHLHPYTIELVSKLGPQYFPIFNDLAPVIPVIQPALWGHIILIGLVLYAAISGVPDDIPQ